MLRKEQLGKHGSQVSDDEPLYDSVASDDDYALTSTDNTLSDTSNQLKVNKDVSTYYSNFEHLIRNNQNNFWIHKALMNAILSAFGFIV